MKLRDIFDHLLGMGIVIGGQNPRNTLGALLSKSPHFETTPDIGWYFKNKAPDREVEGLNGSGSANPEGVGLHATSPQPTARHS